MVLDVQHSVQSQYYAIVILSDKKR